MASNPPEENQPLKSEDDDNDNNNQQQQPEPSKPKQEPEPQQPTPSKSGAAVQQQQQPQEQQPGEERQKDAQDYVQDVGVACNKCYNWFPIGLFGWIGGILLIVCCIIDLFATNLTFTQFFVIALLICGGLIMVLVEMPSAIVKKQRILKVLQLALYEWVKLLSRMWGRGIFSIVLVVMCFSEMGGGFRSLPWIAGMYYSALIVLYFIFGLLAAKKYNGLYVYISTKTELTVNAQQQQPVDAENVGIDDDENKEQEEVVAVVVTDTGNDNQEILRRKFGQKFDELDEDKDGLVGPKDIGRLGVAANLELSNSECHAIITYLDDDCNGEVVKDDFIKMWLRNPRIIWM